MLVGLALIATGYMSPPISKLPFLNIITEVLLMHVPKVKNERDNKENLMHH